ncbi:hypothetical protein ACHAXR_013076 [Thalassiosira sp. AJA248-18]
MTKKQPLLHHKRGNPSVSFQIKLIWINALVLVLFLSFITFNTWVTLCHVLQQQDAAQRIWQETASHAPPPLASTSSPYGLLIPEGSATALPSIRTSLDEEASIKRNFYGGKGDKAHLGGFTAFDPMGVSPTLWTHMVNHLGIKSLLDLGCGRGVSTSWFIIHGLEYVVCAEGSHDAVTQSLLPTIENVPEGTKYDLVEHDFSRGPWWPSRTVDAAWCVEFTEHVGRNFQQNYYTAFRKAALIFVTHSQHGGWHHVEVHSHSWWQVKMEAMGFVYSDILTNEMKKKAHEDKNRADLVKVMKQHWTKDRIERTQNRTKHNIAQHLWTTLQVFINPLVASLPEHAHLFAEHGCLIGKNYGSAGEEKKATYHQECGKEGLGKGASNLTPLPESFKPLHMSKEMDDKWIDLIKDQMPEMPVS